MSKRSFSRVMNVCCLLLAAALLSLPHIAGAQEPDPPSPRVAAAFRRCKRIQRDLERIRGLKFTKDVEMRTESLGKLRKRVKKGLDKQFGTTGQEPYINSLVKLGALQKPIGLTETVMTLLETQAAAHYDPEEEVYCLLMTNMTAMHLDTVSSHELFHALQDQHFDLQKYMPSDQERVHGSGDRMAARQSVVEGEATLIMTLWTLMSQAKTRELTPMIERLAGLAINTQGEMDFDQMLAVIEANRELLAQQGGADVVTSTQQITNMPSFFIEAMFSVYMQGAMMVQRVKSEGGWDAVTALYETPPESTEQVLHPEKLIGERDRPQDASLPDLGKTVLKQWKVLEHDVMGELGVRLLLRVWRDKKTGENATLVAAAAGWGGDHYYYLENAKTGKDLLVWKTAWDSKRDAGEFAVAYRMMLSRRFPEMKKAWRSGKENDARFQVWEVAPGRFLKLASKDKVVGIIDSTDREVMGVLWE